MEAESYTTLPGENGVPIGPAMACGVPAASARSAANPFDDAFLSLRDLAAWTVPDDWVLDPLFCRGELGMISGAPGAGKSLVVQELLMAATTGQTWCGGRFTAPRPIRACYASAEGPRGIKARFAALANWYAGCGVDPYGDDNLQIVRLSPQLFLTDAPTSIFNLADAYERRNFPPLDVLVLDTLHNSTRGADENSSSDAGKILDTLDLVRQRLGCACLLLHHTNKLSHEPRGSSAFTASVDFCLGVKKADMGHGVLSCLKLKDGEPFPDQAFRIESCEGSAVVQWQGEAAGRAGSLADAILSLLRTNTGAKMTATEIAARVDALSQNVSKSLKERLAGSVETSPKDPTQPLNRMTNPAVYWVRQRDMPVPYKENE